MTKVFEMTTCKYCGTETNVMGVANDGTRHPGKACKGRFGGTVETICHRVVFRYWDFDAELTDGLKYQLSQDAEDRAKECITEGCGSGELNSLYIGEDDTEEEIFGWWEIDTD